MNERDNLPHEDPLRSKSRLFDLKYKHLWRLGGAINTSAAIFVGYIVYEYTFFGSNTITLSLGESPLAIIAADAVFDVIRGTHHYLGLRTWQRLSRIDERKEEIQRDIDWLMSIREKRPSQLRK